MHNLLRKTILSILLLLSVVCLAKAQTEYLATVNPLTGAYVKVKSIPPVRYIALFDYSTIDQNNHRFFFMGSYNGYPDSLFTLDEATGNTISTVYFGTNNVVAMMYSNTLNVLYGLQVGTSTVSLVIINPATAQVTLVKNISGIQGAPSDEYTLDENNNQLIIAGQGISGTLLTTVDLITGNVLTQVSIPSNIYGLQYDNYFHALLAIYYQLGHEYFCTVNINTGLVTTLNALDPGIQGILGGSFTYDQTHHIYYFVGNSGGATYLYSINIMGGVTVASPYVDESNSLTEGNIIQFRYDNSSGILYALHWEPVTPLSCPIISAGTISATVCPNTSYQLPSGKLVSGAGVYQDTIRNISGCDSIRTTINLSFYPGASAVTSNVIICPAATYQLPSGRSVSNSGAYQDTIRSSNGCDSVITTVNLSMYPVSVANVTDSFNQGQSYKLPSGIIVDNAGIYQSVLSDVSGCDSTISTTLVARSSSDCVSPPNAFTPNADGYNDVWVVYQHGCVQRVKVDVYNRWGSLVFHSDNYNNDWNGEYNNKPLPDATYYYVVSPVYTDGRQPVLKGNVTILR